jgi:hypothetical protein
VPDRACGGRAGRGYLTSRGQEAGTQRIVGQCLKPSGSIYQTVHLSWVVCRSLHLCDRTFMEQCRVIRIVGEKKHNLVH